MTEVKVTAPLLLISDDDLGVLRALSREAARFGLNVLLDATGKVVELAREHQPAVILVDIHQGRLDGRNALARLRSDPRTSDIDVIVMSGAGEASTETECLVLGATAFEAKPFRAALMADIARLLEERAARDDAWTSYPRSSDRASR